MRLWRLLPVLVALPLSAQQQPIIPDSCLYRIPASAFKRVTVFLEPTADSTAKQILPNADFFAQSVAFKMREMLGGSDASLPQGDTAIQWSRVWGQIEVVAHRGAPSTWRVAEWSMGADTSNRSAVGLLARATANVLAGNENVSLPDGFAGDSMVFALSLGHAEVRKDGKIIPLKSRQPVAVFTLMVPWSAPAELIAFPRIDYPELASTKHAAGMVQLTFVIDKNGRIDTSTLKEIWPPGIKRPTGTIGNAYEAFVRAAKRGLPSGKYKPAMFGGCTMAQYVVQQFNFVIP